MTCRILSRTALFRGRAVAVAMSGVALIRILRSDSQPQLIGIQGHRSVVAVAGLSVGHCRSGDPSALLGRRGSGAGHRQCGLGERSLRSQGSRPDRGRGNLTLRLATANMLLTNSDVEGLAHDLAATGADLLVLQEFTPEHLADITHAGLLIDYPHQILDAKPGFHGSAIPTGFPLLSAGGAFDQAGSPMTRADIANRSRHRGAGQCSSGGADQRIAGPPLARPTGFARPSIHVGLFRPA